MKHSHYLRITTPIILATILLISFFMILPASTKASISTKPETQSEAITITYWHYYTAGREEYMDELIAEFNATNPYSITVVSQYMGHYSFIHEMVIDGLQNGTTLPNVVIAPPDSFAEFARYGGVRFLDDYLNDPVIGIADTADIYPAVLEFYRLREYGNQLAGLQNGRSIEIMYYNADILANAGITVPATWDAFETACISITTATISGTVVDTKASVFANWLWSRDGELLSANMDMARFDEQPGIDSLTFFQQLIDDGHGRLLLGRFEDQTAFGNGEAGFVFGSSANIPYYRAAMEDGAGDNWGVAPPPSLPAHEVVNSYGTGQGILHHNEIEDLASWLFIKWLVEREQSARWAAMSGYHPIRISATTHPSITEKMANDPQYAQALDLLPLGRSESSVRHYRNIRSIIDAAVRDVFLNGANVTNTLHTAADETDAILATYGPDSAIIPPSGGTLIYSSTQGITTIVEFPAGALLVTETVSYVPLDDLPTDGLAFALLPDIAFTIPVTISIHYRDEDVAGMDENYIRLFNYDWGSRQWVDANPCGEYWRDIENNVLQTAVCHFSDYGMMERYNMFLPVIIR